MGFELVLGGLVAVALLVYLLAVLMRPEKFGGAQHGTATDTIHLCGRIRRRAHQGLALVPMFMVQELLEQGELEAVLPAFPHAWPDLHIFMPPQRAGIARVRAFVTFLYQKLDGEV